MNDTLKNLGFLAGATRFRRISEKLYCDGDQVYQDAGIDFKASWFSVYYVLVKSKIPMTIMEITRQIDFSHITVKNVLRSLDKAGLVIIQPNPDDRRSKIITLSDKGHAEFQRMQPLWQEFSNNLGKIFQFGHRDILNILDRIDQAIYKYPLNDRKALAQFPEIKILDYRPDLKKYFFKLYGNWLLDLLDGKLEEEDKYTLKNPDKAYIAKGGFVFFAEYNEKIIGCVALKPLDKETFELVKLYTNPEYRQLGIGTKLMERCISRCQENHVKELWLQTTNALKPAHRLYYKLGFLDQDAPPQMAVLKRTEKIMALSFGK